MTPASGMLEPRTSEPSEYPNDDERRPEQEEGFLELSVGMIEKCELPDTRDEAPRFDFDESALRSRGEEILDGVASCLTQGPMATESISVIGHADPRGTNEYNRGLGRRRAEAARDYLVNRGVPSDRVEVRSRGELDARGTGPESWQLDRRVEIVESGDLVSPD